MEPTQYIFPIYSGGTIVGQGFVTDGYFPLYVLEREKMRGFGVAL